MAQQGRGGTRKKRVARWMRPSLQDAAYSRRGVADTAELREDLLEAGHAEDPAWPAQALRRIMATAPAAVLSTAGEAAATEDWRWSAVCNR